MMFKRVLFIWLVFLIMGGSVLCLASCQRRPPYKIYYLDSEKRFIDDSRVPKGDLWDRPKEEEIKYFFPTGRYSLSVSPLRYYYKIDGYSYVFPGDVEGKNIIDPKGNLLSELDIRNMFEESESGFEEDEGEIFYKTKERINTYKYTVIDEFYSLGGSKFTHYCTKQKPETAPEDLILDDNFIIRLYDKNDKIIDEHKMRNRVYIEDYKKNPLEYQNKIIDSRTDARLIGMLKLPPKSYQRKGLKYRVLRLDEKGEPKPYLYEGAYKYPYQYYLREETLPPYSEYKYWHYSKETGCYSKAADLDFQSIYDH